MPLTPPATSAVSTVLLAVGAGAVVAGTIAGAFALHAKSVMEEECDTRHVCSPRGVDAAQRGKLASLASTGAYAFGAAALLGFLTVKLDY